LGRASLIAERDQPKTESLVQATHLSQARGSRRHAAASG
jgi:hypothetical protein